MRVPNFNPDFDSNVFNPSNSVTKLPMVFVLRFTQGITHQSYGRHDILLIWRVSLEGISNFLNLSSVNHSATNSMILSVQTILKSINDYAILMLRYFRTEISYVLISNIFLKTTLELLRFIVINGNIYYIIHWQNKIRECNIIR